MGPIIRPITIKKSFNNMTLHSFCLIYSHFLKIIFRIAGTNRKNSIKKPAKQQLYLDPRNVAIKSRLRFYFIANHPSVEESHSLSHGINN